MNVLERAFRLLLGPDSRRPRRADRPGPPKPAREPTPEYSPERMEEALGTFKQAFPIFEATSLLDRLRSSEYGRLDEQDQVYLDYTGGGLYAMSQIREHAALLGRSVFGNPHSLNPTSLAMTEAVEKARSYVLEFFNASADEYVAIFTLNATGALKLVAESYPFGPGGHYLVTSDNHNSVNGIREFARARGAMVTYLPVEPPDLHLDLDRMRGSLATGRTGTHRLFAFPAQPNYSGIHHPLEMIAEAQNLGWDVLVDCAAYAPTNRLDLSRWHPDFVPLSFYKMFGYPTGTGCLLARKPALAKLNRPWFAGGTIMIASVMGDGYHFAPGAFAFEDGTVDYLDIPAVEIGLRHIASIGIDTIHDRVTALVGWILEQMQALHHSDGRPLVRIHGPKTSRGRGGNVTFTLDDRDGVPFAEWDVEKLANRGRISLRTGCLCNPGSGEIAHGLTPEEARFFYDREGGVSFLEFRRQMLSRFGKNMSTIRVSVGPVTNFADVYRFMGFIGSFRDRTAAEVAEAANDDASMRVTAAA